MKALTIIPARMAATRLPGKPLADINGAPMIIHVLRGAMTANIGDVVVATDSPEVSDVVRAFGGVAVMTSEAHLSGSDRVYEALLKVDPAGSYNVIVNVQGDLPSIRGTSIKDAANLLDDDRVDIGTLVARATSESSITATSIVKMVGVEVSPKIHRAMYFTRAICPWGEGDYFHHIGLYAWRRASLERFHSLPPSRLEKREKLEQLRALESDMRIFAAEVDDVPIGVDTPADLTAARELMRSGQKY